MADINSTNLSTEAPDFSMLALFMQADLVVKSVIIILILASLYSWNVIISKILRIRQLKKLEKEFEDIFWSGNSFEDLYETLNFNQTDPKSKLFCAAILEWKKSKSQYENDTSDINSLKIFGGLIIARDCNLIRSSLLKSVIKLKLVIPFL